MNRYGGDFNQGRQMRYGRDQQGWNSMPDYDRDYGFRSQQGGGHYGYGRDYADQQPRYWGYRPDHNWYYDQNYHQGYAGGGRPAPRYDYDTRSGFAQNSRPWMRTRPWESPWASRIPGQDYGYGFGYGMGRSPYIYK